MGGCICDAGLAYGDTAKVSAATYARAGTVADTGVTGKASYLWMPMGRPGPILQLCNLAASSIVFMLIDVLLRKQPRLGADFPRSADVGRLERGL